MKSIPLKNGLFTLILTVLSFCSEDLIGGAAHEAAPFQQAVSSAQVEKTEPNVVENKSGSGGAGQRKKTLDPNFINDFLAVLLKKGNVSQKELSEAQEIMGTQLPSFQTFFLLLRTGNSPLNNRKEVSRQLFCHLKGDFCSTSQLSPGLKSKFNNLTKDELAELRPHILLDRYGGSRGRQVFKMLEPKAISHLAEALEVLNKVTYATGVSKFQVDLLIEYAGHLRFLMAVTAWSLVTENLSVLMKNSRIKKFLVQHVLFMGLHYHFASIARGWYNCTERIDEQVTDFSHEQGGSYRLMNGVTWYKAAEQYVQSEIQEGADGVITNWKTLSSDPAFVPELKDFPVLKAYERKILGGDHLQQMQLHKGEQVVLNTRHTVGDQFTAQMVLALDDFFRAPDTDGRFGAMGAFSYLFANAYPYLGGMAAIQKFLMQALMQMDCAGQRKLRCLDGLRPDIAAFVMNIKQYHRILESGRVVLSPLVHRPLYTPQDKQRIEVRQAL